MTGQTGTPIEDVLDQMLLEHGSPTPLVVGNYCVRYPEHRDALMAFSASWAEEIHLPAPAADIDRETILAARAIEGFRQAASARPKRSLAELASAAGKSLEDVAWGLGIDTGIVNKLNARRILPDSIGAQFVSRIARLLNVDRLAVIASWSVAPTPRAAAAFLGQQVQPAQQTFQQALADAGADPALIEELTA